MVEFVRDPATCEKVRFIQKLVQLRVVLLALLLGHQRHNKDTHYNSSEGSATARDRQSGTDDTVDGLLADLWRHPFTTTTPKTMRRYNDEAEDEDCFHCQGRIESITWH